MMAKRSGYLEKILTAGALAAGTAGCETNNLSQPIGEVPVPKKIVEEESTKPIKVIRQFEVPAKVDPAPDADGKVVYEDELYKKPGGRTRWRKQDVEFFSVPPFDDSFPYLAYATIELDGKDTEGLKLITLSPFHITFDFKDGSKVEQPIDYEKMHMSDAEGVRIMFSISGKCPNADFKLKCINPFGSSKQLWVHCSDGRKGVNNLEIDTTEVDTRVVIAAENRKENSQNHITFTGLTSEQLINVQRSSSTVKHEGRPLGDWTGMGAVTTTIGAGKEMIIVTRAYNTVEQLKFKDTNGKEAKPAEPITKKDLNMPLTNKNSSSGYTRG